MRACRVAAALAAGLWLGCHGAAALDDDGAADGAVDADAAGEADGAVDAADGGETVPACGDEKAPRKIRSSIVAGADSFDPSVVALADGQVPAVGAMLERGFTGTYSIICSATLVADTTVLTAAHCVYNWFGLLAPGSVEFAVGRDIAAPDHVFAVSSLAANPAYNRTGGGATQAQADEAVLVLAESASAAVPGLRPIPINRAPLPDGFLDAVVQNAGYGSTDPGGGDNTLRWWTTETVTDVSDYDYTVYGGGVSSVCFGDSGGPGLWTFPDGTVRVAGTVSWGDASCVDHDHFARTDYNLDFLLPYVGPADPCDGLDWTGRCDGDVAVWCVDGTAYRRDCAACGQACGDTGAAWGFYCS